MKAVVWHGKRDVQVEEVPDPAIEEPTDVIVPHKLPLEDAPHAYRIFQRKEEGAIKVLLQPGRGGVS